MDTPALFPGKPRAILYLTAFRHSPLFLPQRLELEFTHLKIRFLERPFSKPPEPLQLPELRKLTLPFPDHIRLQPLELQIVPE
jgi:hypothetical protein